MAPPLRQERGWGVLPNWASYPTLPYKAAMAAETLKLRNVGFQKRIIGEVEYAFLGKTSYSMIFSIERHMGITAKTEGK